MSVDNDKVIDLLAANDTGNVMLIITDHYEWIESESYEHAMKLQNKINAYLAFVESGQLEKENPQYKGRKVEISVHAKFPLNKLAEDFYAKASQIVEGAGMKLSFEHVSK